jgi:hypothetical protein
MSTITGKDYDKVQEPCKSCPSGLEAYGRGKNKTIHCKANHAKLMGEGDPNWYQFPKCPYLDK